MRAIVCSKYGKPEVLLLRQVDLPEPKDNEVRIKLHAAIVTPSDCAFRKADPFIIRLMYGLRKPKHTILGVEFAGEIDAVGKSVTAFRAGDRVSGISPTSFGAYAEYVCLPEAATMASLPVNASFEEAAGLCDGALTALIFLRDTAQLKRGQKILINGASGSVGAYAVQLAKYFGAEVTGVCSSTNAAFVKSLGADRVIDYTQEDFTKSGQSYDVIFDAIGKRSFTQCKDSLSAKGVYLTTVPSLGIMLQMLWTSKLSSKKAKFTAAGLQQKKENLAFLGKLFEAGHVKAVIDRRYPLEKMAEAHSYVDTGRKKGNVVITFGAHPLTPN
ncbi:NAD(P)-dependent alcohol dehydrogenase [Paenibacillus qinlingensis]|uniref:NADPH:quinone reductase-like Zn-dependent oxidoreductase n=1 Tax=Paenibacillus qinlingensis TaxID=1837343 RepID=A0ABU1P3V3_9BACL|nr:NAD(P)-dependent alcohol dehydrogenase [Paenibacillus qinlingensis]MDR6554431.1 NADPH:quinone reductase-like Zn-dependent oxidoreductase [Paenibacillus qinlingensis]